MATASTVRSLPPSESAYPRHETDYRDSQLLESLRFRTAPRAVSLLHTNCGNHLPRSLPVPLTS